MTDFSQVEFVKSSTTLEQCPSSRHTEFAFIGRSNVGKSSLINALTGKKGLAKISSTPGKTKTINHFLIDKSIMLADLPGYGYAKVSKKERTGFAGFTKSYLLGRETLTVLFILIDIRVPPQKIDIEFINTMGENGLPIALIFTKLDKVKPGSVEGRIKEFFDALSEYWEEMPAYFITSSEKGGGIDKVQEYMDQIHRTIYK
jgi:GTP-binding protein